MKNGRLVLDEPTSLPDGTVIDLVVDDEGDELNDEERRALNSAIEKAWESAKAGSLRTAQEVIGNFARESLGNMTEGFTRLTGMSLDLTQTIMAPIHARVRASLG